MKPGNRKGIIAFVIAFASICTFCMTGSASAQEKWNPAKGIKFMIGFSPGGPIDLGTRIIMEELSKELKTSIIIEYKPGANGAIANSAVMEAKPDGYTLLSQFDASFINQPAMEKNPTYDPVTAFSPVAIVSLSPSLLTANSSSKLSSFRAMIEFAKQNPGKLNCSTSGVGTTSHLILEYLRNHGVDITHVPAKGAAPAATDLVGNHVDLAGTVLAPVASYIKSGQLRPLVVTTKLKQLPEVPTWAEVGYPEVMMFGNWHGLLAPPNLPKTIQNSLALAVEKVMHLPSIIQAMEKAGFTPVYKGPEELKKMTTEQYKIIREIATTAGLVK